MSEKIQTGPNPEDDKKREEVEEEERLADWLSRHPDPKIVSEEALAVAVAEYRGLVESFGARYSLEKLYSIVELSPGLTYLFTKDREMSASDVAQAISELSSEDAEKFRIRTAARKDLELIDKIFRTLPEGLEELKAEYFVLSRAVGLLHRGKIDHER